MDLQTTPALYFKFGKCRLTLIIKACVLETRKQRVRIVDLGDRSEPAEAEAGDGLGRLGEPSQVASLRYVELTRHRLQPLLVSVLLQQAHRRRVPLECRVCKCINLFLHIKMDAKFTSHYS